VPWVKDLIVVTENPQHPEPAAVLFGRCGQSPTNANRNAILERFWPQANKIARALAHHYRIDPDNALAITTDCLLEAIASYSLSYAVTFRTYWGRKATRRCIADMRGHSGMRQIDTLPEELLPNRGMVPTDTEQWEAMVGLLGGSEPIVRVVILLHRLLGLSVEQVAFVIGESQTATAEFAAKGEREIQRAAREL